MVVTVSHDDRAAANKKESENRRLASLAKAIARCGRKLNYTGYRQLDSLVGEGQILALADDPVDQSRFYPEGQFFRHERSSVMLAGKSLNLLHITPLENED